MTLSTVNDTYRPTLTFILASTANKPEDIQEAIVAVQKAGHGVLTDFNWLSVPYKIMEIYQLQALTRRLIDLADDVLVVATPDAGRGQFLEAYIVHAIEQRKEINYTNFDYMKKGILCPHCAGQGWVLMDHCGQCGGLGLIPYRPESGTTTTSQPENDDAAQV